MFSRHREPWFGVELGGAGMALAGVPWFGVKFVGLTDIPIVLLNDGWVTANDPLRTHKEKPPEGSFNASL